MPKLKSWTTTNNYKIHWLVWGKCNVYLVQVHNHNILIDTGPGIRYHLLEKELQHILSKNQSLTYIIHTHTHFDHCQNTVRVQNQFGGETLVHQQAEQCVENGYTTLSDGTYFVTKILARLGNAIGKTKFGYPAFSANLIIGNAHTINDLNIDIINTPGHSPDSCSVLVDNEIALVGDTLLGLVRNKVFPIYANDVPALLKSWKNLLNTDCHTFLPGHGKPVSREMLLVEFEKMKLKYSRKQALSEV
ncbi:MAG: MBL fold metallo-hydrolase [Bacteroidales bacterium]|nr:MBL fold metallo-hydrolase [Bacteroidales bacterium]